jgi:hypothetical protein
MMEDHNTLGGKMEKKFRQIRQPQGKKDVGGLGPDLIELSAA